MKIVIEEEDILEIANSNEKQLLTGKKAAGTLGSGKNFYGIFTKLIIKSIASLGRSAQDEQTKLDQILVKIEIEGKPFNVGIGGSVEYTYKQIK